MPELSSRRFTLQRDRASGSLRAAPEDDAATIAAVAIAPMSYDRKMAMTREEFTKRLDAIIDELEDEYEYSGGDSADGGLEPGLPN